MKQRPFALAAADLDGDGREDLAVLATESGGDSQGFVVPWIAGPTADGARSTRCRPEGARSGSRPATSTATGSRRSS
jgi:hypothetical protein